MKKIISFPAVFILSLVILSSCSFSFNGAFKDGPNLTIITGILEEQASDDQYNGTHIIKDDTGKITPVRSTAINLSNAQYLGNKIQATGVMNDQEGIFEVTGLSVLEVLSKVEKKVEFVVYKNTDLGFELKYYNDWAVDESENEVVFSAPVSEESKVPDSVVIKQIPFNEEENLSTEEAPVTEPEAANEGEMSENPLFVYVKQSYPEISDPGIWVNKIGIDKLDAVRLEEGENTTVYYYLYRDGLIYEISFIPAPQTVASNKKVFNEMLAEFKFVAFTVEDTTPPADDSEIETSNIESETGDSITEFPAIDMEFATFESLIYSFSAKYPAKWYYAGTSFGGDVLHHYGFSDESVTSDNEYISLDVISGSLPSGQKVSFGSVEGVKVSDSLDQISFYLTIAGHNFRIYGGKEYASIMMIMAGSITPIEKVEGNF